LILWILVGFFWLLFFRTFLNDVFFKKSLTIFGKGFISICGIRVLLKSGSVSKNTNNTVIVSNHISWLDIFAIHSLGIPAIFIAKSEIKKWPLLGVLVSNAGTIFIDRTKRNSILLVLEKCKNLLSQGKTIVFFPEGTTSDGSKILPFHTSLFSLFLDFSRPKLTPIVIQYKKLGKKTVEPAYIGDMSILDSIFKVLKSNDLEIHVEILNSVTTQVEKLSGDFLTKRNLAQIVRDRMMTII